MSKVTLAKALKNPELRMELGLESPAGQSLSELTQVELERINGGAIEAPKSTPTVGVGVSISLVYCP